MTFEEFLILARNTVPDLSAIIKYVHTPVEPHTKSFLGFKFNLPTSIQKPTYKRKEVHQVESLTQYQSIIAEQKGVVVLEVGFTFCKPCKKFEPKYRLFAEHYSDMLFLVVYGNQNEGTKKLCKNILKIKATPSFYIYVSFGNLGANYQ